MGGCSRFQHSAASSSICRAVSWPNVEKKLSGSLIVAYRRGSHRAQWLRAITPYRFIVDVLFPGQPHQVLEGELAVDLGLVVPPPSRYHAGSPLPGCPGRDGWQRQVLRSGDRPTADL